MMPRRLPLPIRRVLRAPYDDAELEALLARRALRRRRASSGTAILALCAAAIGIVVLLASAIEKREGGPLHLTSGDVVPERIGETVALDDGSTIALRPDASLRTLVNDAREVSFLLDQGRATFDVRPGGPRRWTIECGLATVVVLGTRFTLDRSDESLRVTVERGAVLVRGDLVPDRARRLGAGDALQIPAEPTPVEAAIVRVEPAPIPVAPAVADPPRRDRSRVARWRALASSGAWREAYDELGSAALRAEVDRASVEDLLVLADVARLSGHPEDAVVPLERVVSHHRDDPHAALAAMSLGRVEDRLGRPTRAARAFATALELGVPRDLESDALARLATSLRAAGDTVAAREAARRYRTEHPDGSHAAAMRSIEESR